MFTFDDAMRPILETLDTNGQMKAKEIADAIADHFKLSEEERLQRLPSGTQQTYRNRVGWATSNLYKAKCIERIAHGVYRIAPAGQALLADHAGKIDNDVLRSHSEEFSAYYDKVVSTRQSALAEKRKGSAGQPEEQRAPEEVLAEAHRELNDGLAAEIKLAILDRSPDFFEELVVRLLVKMGYGGSFADAAQSVGKTGDGGIDGIIKEDKLGLDVIYLQAKRWSNTVHRPEIDKFIGALTRQRARKGVFITTSDFSAGAREAALGLDIKVVLIDGEELARLMVENNLGVSVKQVYEVKQLDSDYFAED